METTNAAELEKLTADSLLRAGVVSGQRVIVACSGGADSVALLHLAAALTGPLGITLYACHVRHGQRGVEDDNDAALTEKHCRRLDVPLDITCLDRPDVQRERSRCGSLEGAMRRLRYHRFREAAQRRGAQWVLTAHHAMDQAETVLFRACRGMDWRSLACIPERRGIYVRPLLKASGGDLERYCRENGLSVADDSTNRDNAMARNRLRNLIIPQMTASFHSETWLLLDRLASAVSRLTAVEEKLLQETGCTVNGTDPAAATPWEVVCPGLNLNSLERLKGELLRGAVVRLVHSAAGFYPGRVPLNELENMIVNNGGGDIHLGLGYLARIGSGILLILGPGAQNGPWTEEYRLDSVPGRVGLASIGAEFTAESADAAGETGHQSRLRVLVPAAGLKTPLTVRTRRPGDRLRLPGRNGTRKLKKLFIDRKVPRHQRDSLPLVVDAQGEILWVPGVALSQKACMIHDTEGGVVALSISAVDTA